VCHRAPVNPTAPNVPVACAMQQQEKGNIRGGVLADEMGACIVTSVVGVYTMKVLTIRAGILG
jgi:hypothetical protein